jgi:threonine-phosphate decarboxylase
MKETSEDYKHGGAPQLDMRRLGLEERAVLDFSVNLNPLGPPAIIKRKWPELYQTIEPYPSIEADGVSRYYGKVCGIDADHILVGNGSTELIYLVPRVLGFKRVALITPSFHDYERASRLAGAQVSSIP